MYKTCSDSVLSLEFSCNELVNGQWTMDNLLSYCGLVDARLRTSEKDLPVHEKLSNRVDKDFENNK